MNWNGQVLSSYDDLIREVSLIETKERAQEFLAAYRQVNAHAADNIGWMIGDVNREVGTRIINLFGCYHPVFGNRFPTPEEAFRIGVKYGEILRDGGPEAVKKLLANTVNPNPWFVGLD